MSDSRRLARKARMLRWLLNLYPPYLGAGIRVQHISPDMRSIRVRMKLTRWNRNYVGTHFGGSLFAMTDPFWMLLAMNALGREFWVWDKAGSIEFVKPGRGTVHADFRLSDEVLDELRAATANGEKALRWFDTDVIDADGRVRQHDHTKSGCFVESAEAPVAARPPVMPDDRPSSRGGGPVPCESDRDLWDRPRTPHCMRHRQDTA